MWQAATALGNILEEVDTRVGQVLEPFQNGIDNVFLPVVTAMEAITGPLDEVYNWYQ
jgi:hypothetical protein